MIRKNILLCFLLLLATMLMATQMYVVGEVFTMTWCAPCIAARSALHQMYFEEHNYPYLIPLIWQGDGPHLSPNYTNRASLYGVTFLPHSQWNGTIAVIDVDYPGYVNAYNFFAGQTSPLVIDLQATVIEPDQLMLEAETLMTGNITTPDNWIQFILTYDLIGVMEPDYFASVKEYHQDIFPLTTAGQFGTFSHTFTLDPSWEYDNLRAIVIVQSLVTGNATVHQAAKAMITIPDLAAPENIIVTIDENTVNLSWDPVNNAISYRVYSSDDPYTEDWGEPVSIVEEPFYSEELLEKRFYRITASSEIVSSSSMETFCE